MIEMANNYNFPIIGFTKEVSFIDITKESHELLIGYHEDNSWSLKKYINNYIVNC